MAKIKPHTVTAPSGESITIWAVTSKLTPYLGALTPDGDFSPAFTTVPRKAFSRKQYPGQANPVTVSAGDTRRYVAPNVSEATLPGQNAYIEEPVAGANPPKTKVVTITFEGAFGDLHQYCLANRVKGFTLRSPGGKAKDVPAPV